MIKILEQGIDEPEEICKIGKALSSPARIEILELLSEESLNIGEIAKRMNIPASSAAFHLKMMEEAGLLRMDEQPGTRGNAKLCARRVDRIFLNLFTRPSEVAETFTVEMPIGAYSECNVHPTCGMANMEGIILSEDQESNMYLPDRLNAGIIWGSGGYVEYRFPNGVPHKSTPGKLMVSMEICSEAPGYRNDWKSDITLWINGTDCGTYTSPGDFGERRGRLNPSNWPNGSTQHGQQVIWEIDARGCQINGSPADNTTASLASLSLMKREVILVRIGNKPDAENQGGFNLFGKHFGDYSQDIIMTIEY